LFSIPENDCGHMHLSVCLTLELSGIGRARARLISASATRWVRGLSGRWHPNGCIPVCGAQEQRRKLFPFREPKTFQYQLHYTETFLGSVLDVDMSTCSLILQFLIGSTSISVALPVFGSLNSMDLEICQLL
jgi:hypothetical protein